MSKPVFQKMWEASATYRIFYIDTGSVMPMVETLKKVAGHADKYWMYFCDGKIGGAYYNHQDMEEAARQGAKNFLDPIFRQNYFTQADCLIGDIQSYIQNVEKSGLSNLDPASFRSYLEELVRLDTEIFGYYLACQPQCLSEVETMAKAAVAKLVPEEQSLETYNLVSTSTDVTTLRQEEIDWLHLLLVAKRGNDSERAIDTHHRKYHLLNASEGYQPWSREHFAQKFQEESLLSSAEIQKKLDAIVATRDTLITTQADTAKKYGLDQTVLEICSILAKISHARLEIRLSGWMPTQYYLSLFLKEIGQKFGYAKEEIEQLRLAEILALLDGQVPNREELRRR